MSFLSIRRLFTLSIIDKPLTCTILCIPLKSLDPSDHEPRQLGDWSNQKLAKEINLKPLNPSIVELMDEFEFDRIDQLLSFSPLHFKEKFFI